MLRDAFESGGFAGILSIVTEIVLLGRLSRFDVVVLEVVCCRSKAPLIGHHCCGVAAFDRRILAGYLAEDLRGLGLRVPNLRRCCLTHLFAICNEVVAVVFSRL